MKRLLQMAFLLAVLAPCAWAEADAQTLGKDRRPKPVLLAPDLITDGIDYSNLYSGELKIAVRNIGNKESASSEVKLRITMPGEEGGGSFYYSGKVPTLKAGDYAWIPVSTGKHLNLAKYCVRADALEQVKESNEANNQRCGEFEGKQ